MGRRPGRRGIDRRAEPRVPGARAPRVRGRRGGARARRQRGRRDRRRGGRSLLRPAAVRRAREGETMKRAPLRPVLYDDARDVVRLLDQRLLPADERWLELATSGEVAQAIKDL